jgi:hypothetical protein
VLLIDGVDRSQRAGDEGRQTGAGEVARR